ISGRRCDTVTAIPTNCATLLRNSWSRPWVTRPITAARRSRDTSATPGRQATTEAMPRIATCCASSAVAIFFMESPSTAATVWIAARSSLWVCLLMSWSFRWVCSHKAGPADIDLALSSRFRSVHAFESVADIVAKIDEAVLDVATDALDAVQNGVRKARDAAAEAFYLLHRIEHGRSASPFELCAAVAHI